MLRHLFRTEPGTPYCAWGEKVLKLSKETGVMSKTTSTE